MCEILIHNANTFEPATFHASILYSNLLSTQTVGLLSKRTGEGDISILDTISYSLVLAVWLGVMECKCMHV